MLLMLSCLLACALDPLKHSPFRDEPPSAVEEDTAVVPDDEEPENEQPEDDSAEQEDSAQEVDTAQEEDTAPEEDTAQEGDSAQAEEDTAEDEPAQEPTDLDGDGFEAPDDCDDNDASVHPGAAEPIDGVDNDCDGDTDLENSRFEGGGGSTLYIADLDFTDSCSSEGWIEIDGSNVLAGEAVCEMERLGTQHIVLSGTVSGTTATIEATNDYGTMAYEGTFSTDGSTMTASFSGTQTVGAYEVEYSGSISLERVE